MLRYFLHGCILLFTFLYSHHAFAECHVVFRGLPTNQSIVVDAQTIASVPLTKTVNFTVENIGDSACYYFVTIDAGVSGDIQYNRLAKITHALPALFQNANSDSISYQLYSEFSTESNIVTALNRSTTVDNVLGVRQIQPGQMMSDSFLVHVPAQTLPNLIAESYDDDIILTLYQNPYPLMNFLNDCTSCVEETHHLLNLKFNITDYVTLSLGSSYNPDTKHAFLNFGELTPLAQQSFEVYVGGRSGMGSICSATISSENGSKLVRKDISRKDIVGMPKHSDEVQYTVHAQSAMGDPIVSGVIDLSIPNHPVQLATSSVPFVCGNNNTGVMGVEVFITIGETEKKNSGIYRDTLTVEVMIGL